MSAPRGLRILLVMISLAGRLGVSAAHAQEEFARVVSVRGPVKVQRRLGGEGEPLKHGLAEGDALRVGWTIRCDPGGFIDIQLGAAHHPIENKGTKGGPPVFYTI